MGKIKLTYKQILHDAETLVQQIQDNGNALKIYDNVYGVPRGGVPVALLVAQGLHLPLIDNVEDVNFHTLVVDDLIDSGKTRKKFSDSDFAVLYRKPHSPVTAYSVKEYDGWVEFPYEDSAKDEQDIIVRLLEVLGENPNREGLLETPKRVIKFYKQFLDKPEFNFTTFSNEGYDEMIVQKDIPFFSLCEHHMAPFFGHATVAYIPNGKIVGLSKLARTVEHYASNLQNQERITTQVAERLEKELDPLGVAVVLSARHFCMEMRGVKTHDVSTISSKLIGVFKDKPEVRAEFMQLMKG